MRRKKTQCHLAVILFGVIVQLWYAAASDGSFLAGGASRASADGDDFLAGEILQQLSDDFVPYQSMTGLKERKPSEQRKGSSVAEVDPLTPIKGERDQMPSPARSYGSPYSTSDETVSAKGDINEPPFEVEETLNPYDFVNIDRGPPDKISSVPADKESTGTDGSRSPGPASSAVLKRAGEKEYDTFVNIPAMRKMETLGPVAVPKPLAVHSSSKRVTGNEMGDTLFYAIAAVCSVAAVLGLIFAAVSYTRLRRQYKESQFNEYPSFGLPGSRKSRSPDSVAAMDSKLASAAQLYHFQHTKQQIISMEHPSCDVKEPISDESEAEEDEGDYSVYECPGLAPTGDMEINNPMFVQSNGGGNGNGKTEPNGQPPRSSAPNLSAQ